MCLFLITDDNTLNSNCNNIAKHRLRLVVLCSCSLQHFVITQRKILLLLRKESLEAATGTFKFEIKQGYKLAT